MLIMQFTLLDSPGWFLLSKCIDGNGESLEKGVKCARVIHHAEVGGKQRFLLLTRILRKTHFPPYRLEHTQDSLFWRHTYQSEFKGKYPKIHRHWYILFGLLKLFLKNTGDDTQQNYAWLNIPLGEYCPTTQEEFWPLPVLLYPFVSLYWAHTSIHIIYTVKPSEE